MSGKVFEVHPEPIFRTLFFRGKSLSAEFSSEFLGKTIFQNFFFRGKFQFFATFFFWGGVFFEEFFLGIFRGKMYEKSAPEIVEIGIP
jgi:hypothetical protein